MLLSIVARVACATVLLAAETPAAVARGPLDEIMDTSFVVVAVMGGHHAALYKLRVSDAETCEEFIHGHSEGWMGSLMRLRSMEYRYGPATEERTPPFGAQEACWWPPKQSTCSPPGSLHGDQGINSICPVVPVTFGQCKCGTRSVR